MSFLIIELHEAKSYRVSLNVVSNYSKPTSQTTCRIQLCDASNQLRYETTRNQKGSCHFTAIGTLAVQPLTWSVRGAAVT